jgi:hypothetical protein
VADLIDGIARHLAGLGLVTYDPDGIIGDCFAEVQPAQPDSIVTLTLYGGAPIDSLLPYDTPSLQVRTRGDADPRTSRTRAQGIYEALNGLGPTTLADGSYLLLAVANQTPSFMGQDSLGRCEHVVNFSLEVHAPSAHRPA